MATYLPAPYTTARPDIAVGDVVGTGLDRLAFACLFVFVLALPSEEHFPTLGGFLINRWLGIVAFAATLLRIVFTFRIRKPGVLHHLMAAMAIWAGATIFWSLDPVSTTDRIITYLQLLLVVWLIWILAVTAQRVRLLLSAYCVGTWAPAIATIREYLAGHVLVPDSGEVRFAPIGINANDLGLILALSVPMTLYKLARSKSKIIIMLCWFHLLLVSTATLLTGSRGGLISLAVAFMMFPLIVPALPKWQRRLSVLLFAGTLAFSAFLVPAKTWERLRAMGTELTEGTMTKRTLIWKAGLETFQENPFIGVGAGAYGASVLRRLDVPLVAHNTFISVLVELGIVGGLLMAALLASMFLCAARMPYLERRLWTVVLLTWMVGVSALTWEYRKSTWFLMAMLAAHAGCAEVAASRLNRARFAGRFHQGLLRQTRGGLNAQAALSNARGMTYGNDPSARYAKRETAADQA